MTQIEALVMLIQLGVATITQVRDYLRQQVSDDETLAKILTDVEWRLARRGGVVDRA